MIRVVTDISVSGQEEIDLRTNNYGSLRESIREIDSDDSSKVAMARIYDGDKIFNLLTEQMELPV